ncbi:unnamed protein product [Discosporangium mesarthrocarpum]
MVVRCLELKGSSGKMALGAGRPSRRSLEFPERRCIAILEPTTSRKQVDNNSLIDPFDVPTVHCTSYREWAAKAGVPLSSLWRLCKCVGVWRHTRWVKPILTDKQRVDRVGFVLSHLHRRGGGGVFVNDMFSFVHVDERSGST